MRKSYRGGWGRTQARDVERMKKKDRKNEEESRIAGVHRGAAEEVEEARTTKNRLEKD